jgi:hypothetical protein
MSPTTASWRRKLTTPTVTLVKVNYDTPPRRRNGPTVLRQVVRVDIAFLQKRSYLG